MGDNDTANPNTYTTTVSLDIKGICDAVSDKLDIGAIKEGVLEDLDVNEAIDMTELLDALDMDSIADYVMDQMDGDYRLESIVENFIDGADLVTCDDLGPAIESVIEDLIPEVSSERVQDIEADVTKLEEAVFGSNEEGCVVVTSRNLLEVLGDVLSDPLAASKIVTAFGCGIMALIDANNRQAQTIQVLKEEVEAFKGNPTPTE